MKIALLTCERLPELTESDRLLIPELAKHQIEAQAVIWNDKTIDWTKFDCLIFRNTWDYYQNEKEFNLWLSQLEKAKIKTLNALEIVQRNKHKFYLRDLQQQGIAILPTIFIDPTSTLNLGELLPKEWKKAVIKPAFSAGSYLTEVFEVSEITTINQKYRTLAAEKALLLQEFWPQIQTEGETSLVFFNKQFSHAVNKKPATGDFRIQVQFGGKYTSVVPEKSVIEQAQKIVDTFPEKLLYARVDGIITNGKLYLMEVECIEPDLYFSYNHGAREKFVSAILELIH